VPGIVRYRGEGAAAAAIHVRKISFCSFIFCSFGEAAEIWLASAGSRRDAKKGVAWSSLNCASKDAVVSVVLAVIAAT
jgi:hypothetical protein